MEVVFGDGGGNGGKCVGDGDEGSGGDACQLLRNNSKKSQK